MAWRETATEVARARAERPVRVAAPLGDLAGLLTPPAPEAPPSGVCVVLFTRPRSHRNRMWVEGARRLAAAGHACFRFDYHGTGDSGGVSTFLDPNQPYRDDALAVIRHLRAHEGQTRFVLVGMCFDARTALSAFDGEAEAIEGLVFLSAPVVELEHLGRARVERKGWKQLAGTLRNPENWKALARAERWRYMADVVGHLARRSAAPGGEGGGIPLAASFVDHFGALVRSKARALFLYGDADDEYQSFRIAEQTVLAKLDRATRARFDVEVWPGPMHGFLAVARQREAVERVLAWIEDTTRGAGRNGDGRAHAREATWTSA